MMNLYHLDSALAMCKWNWEQITVIKCN